MSIEFIGFIAHQEASEAVTPQGGLIDPDFIAAYARTQEYGGFDRALIAYHSGAPDGVLLAAHAARDTRRLGLLVAHRPGVVAPTVAARQFATLDHLSGGRAAVNIISGANPAELRRDGDFLDHDQRYARTDEYLQILRQAWQADSAFDFSGQHYRLEGYAPQVRPRQATADGAPGIPVFFSGSSPAAWEVAGKHADVYMMWGEPLAGIREQIAAVSAVAARHQRARPLGFSLSVRPILAATESEAWARAERILAATQARLAQRAGSALAQAAPGQPQNVGSQRLARFAAAGAVLDRCLWTGITSATGAVAGSAASTGVGGNSTALVGTPAQVAEALLAYHQLGVDRFLLRGFEPLQDAVLIGRELIPEVRRQLAHAPLAQEAA